MRYKELKEKVEEWGQKYNYKPVVEVDPDFIYMRLNRNVDRKVFEIHKSERFVIDLNWKLYRSLPDDAKEELFKIVTEFAATDPPDREDEKRFIIPLPYLVTTDGRQQYLTKKDGYLFACRKKTDKTLMQTWTEDRLKFLPEIYTQFAVEFDEEKEY